MKYIYWFKQQSVAFVWLAIWGSIGYIIPHKLMGNESEYLILTPDRVVSILTQALTFIFIGPFFFKWWDPTNEE